MYVCLSESVHIFMHLSVHYDASYLSFDGSSRLNHHKSLDGNRYLLAEIWIKGVLVLWHTTTLN